MPGGKQLASRSSSADVIRLTQHIANMVESESDTEVQVSNDTPDQTINNAIVPPAKKVDDTTASTSTVNSTVSVDRRSHSQQKVSYDCDSIL